MEKVKNKDDDVQSTTTTNPSKTTVVNRMMTVDDILNVVDGDGIRTFRVRKPKKTDPPPSETMPTSGIRLAAFDISKRLAQLHRFKHAKASNDVEALVLVRKPQGKVNIIDYASLTDEQVGALSQKKKLEYQRWKESPHQRAWTSPNGRFYSDRPIDEYQLDMLIYNEDFWTEERLRDVLVPLVNEHTVTTMRDIVWLWNYAKETELQIMHRGRIVKVIDHYTQTEKTYHRRLFDIFRRVNTRQRRQIEQIKIYFMLDGKEEFTTVANLHCLQWMWDHGYLKYVENNRDEIRAHRRLVEKRNKEKKLADGNRGIMRRNELTKRGNKNCTMIPITLNIQFRRDPNGKIGNLPAQPATLAPRVNVLKEKKLKAQAAEKKKNSKKGTSSSSSSNKRKRESVEDESTSVKPSQQHDGLPVKRKRGRPRKNPIS